ncbi:NADH-quinone oxidoreductase subunit J [Opitutus sp. GAS368]|jgi:NADH-quinone oxidoreductase subunit J|uniref:NADH-quinone oxidoreductase subunit J family protein n=1 Tax=Opitutus sp. GAS368 TaxID=1882749 RepID=UPI00087B25CA|nr:NADH-quinone oxidoreductase subunit J [Opitutus sp. GAS368]SDS14306.1 NADH dehydrogenase subunit J [Opitutus sp. GAS368]
MSDTLFLILSVLTVATALLVVLNKNAVNAAMFLLLSLVGLAGLFVLLDAPLLAFVLILVYAGAVVALFLFIIMLLDTTPGSFKAFKPLTIVASALGAALLGLGIWSLVHRAVLPPAPDSVPVPTMKHYAEMLFTTYLLPVQVVGFMLLIAMLGVIVLSKKYTEDGEQKTENR